MTSKIFMDDLRAVAADLLGAYEAPGGVTAAEGRRRDWQEQLAEARGIVLQELDAMQILVFEACSEQNRLSVLYTYLRAARDACPSINLRLMAKAIAGLLRRRELSGPVFNGYVRMLQNLTREEILVIGALHRHRKKAEADLGANPHAVIFWSAFIGEMIPAHFRSERQIRSICEATLRSALIDELSDPNNAGLYTTTEVMDDLAELVDFDDALGREMATPAGPRKIPA